MLPLQTNLQKEFVSGLKGSSRVDLVDTYEEYYVEIRLHQGISMNVLRSSLSLGKIWIEGN